MGSVGSAGILEPGKAALAVGFFVLGETFGQSGIGHSLRTLMNVQQRRYRAHSWSDLAFIERDPELLKAFRVVDTHVIALFHAPMLNVGQMQVGKPKR